MEWTDNFNKELTSIYVLSGWHFDELNIGSEVDLMMQLIQRPSQSERRRILEVVAGHCISYHHTICSLAL